MCRVLAYLGEPVLLDDLLYKPDSSLIRQTYAPKMLNMLNLAGFGMAAWDRESFDADRPFMYRTSSLPVFDANLRALAQKIRPSSVLAHVRGVAYSEFAAVGSNNLHPFRYDGFRLALAHNGELSQFDEMKVELLPYIRPEIAKRIRGTTDSEWMYALLMSLVADPTKDLDHKEITHAVLAMLRILRKVRDNNGIATSSSVNLFLCDGNDLVATRFTFDFGCYADKANEANLSFLSLWYTFGQRFGLCDDEWRMIGDGASYESVMVASEPLTRDVSTWLEVPEYTMLYVSHDGGRRRIRSLELDV